MDDQTLQTEELQRVQVVLPAEMVQEIHTHSSLTKNQAEILADEGFKLRKEIKQKEKRLEDVKADLLTYAIHNRVKEVVGEDGKFMALDEEKVEIDIEDLLHWLEKNHQEELLPKLVTVVKRKLEHELGGHVVDSLGVKRRKEYAKCVFKGRDDLT